jgi:hypothetical protein
MMKRTRSVPEKTNSINFKCKECDYSARSKWALKAHINHKHQEPTSPDEKKPRVGAVVVKDILSEVVQNIAMEEESDNKIKTTIEPTMDFLTNTAVTLAEMLDNIAGQIDENQEDEDDDTEELENRLDILRGDKPRNMKDDEAVLENTLVTLPLKDVEELRLKLRSLEEINEDLSHRIKDFEELKVKFKNLEDTNKELAHKLKESEENQKRKEPKKNKEHTREKFIVIDMETNDEDDGIDQLIRNKENGFSRANPQSEAKKKKEVKMFDCPGCNNKFSKREDMLRHKTTHEMNCLTCDKTFNSNSELQKHVRIHHDEMICHVQCEGGQCIRGESGALQELQCNFCEEMFTSKNTLSRHKADVHRTFKPCRDPINCVFQVGCYFSHVAVNLGKVRCFQCGEEFASKNIMMIHRKIHGGVKECNKLINNQCQRGDSCWWSHEKNEQVFQQVRENLPPPIQVRQEQKSQMEMQNTLNLILVNMLKVMDIELKKIKEVLNIN